jgi:iron complex outermembrane receptor protein
VRIVVRLLACTILVLLAPLTLAAQNGIIQGTVTDHNGQPLEAAAVTVEGIGFRSATDLRGAYEIRAVPAGTYTLRVRLLSYGAQQAQVTVPAGDTVRQDFSLGEEALSLDEIEVVVGSRAHHTAADELAVPVDVFTAEELQMQGSVEPSRILQELSPSVNFPRQSVADATDIVRPFTLRGLSPDHTLVLLNGRRRHRSALVHIFGAGMGAGASGIDLNALPSHAIDRIEVLRDGAAAQYGSDAIAGVVNVALKDGVFEPTLTADVGRYTPEEFDDDGTVIGVTGGWGIAAGPGSVGLFAEYRDRDPTNRAGADPEDQVVPGDADVIDEDGNVVEKRNPVPQPNHHWGDGNQDDILTFVNARFPTNPGRTSEIYAFGGYSSREGQGNGFRRQGLSSRNWPEIYPLGFLPTFDADVVDYSAAGGVRGIASDWAYDVGASYGYNSFQYNLTNTLNVSLGPCLDVPCAPGVDRVFGTPDDPGIPNQTEIFAGELKLFELVAGADVSRAIDVGLPSPLNVAFGAAFRRENYRIVPGEKASWIDGGHLNRDSLPASPGSQVFSGFRPEDETDESRNNFGVYVDLESKLTPRFLANVAGRFETYSDFGERLTGKLALRYQPTTHWTLRGAVSTGFRAPALSQSFYASIATNFAPDPVTGAPTPFEVGIFPVNAPASRALGAEDLVEETSVNVSGGLALTPVDNLNLTFDYFYIRVDDRIILTSELSGPEIEAILEAQNVPAQAARFFTNAIDTRTQGVDVTASYRAALGPTSLLTLTGVFNWTENEILGDIPLVPGTSVRLFEDFLEGGTIALEKERPEWRGTLTTQFTDGRLSLLGRASLWGKFTSALLGICEECVQEYGSEGLFDAEVGYRFSNRLSLAFGAKNIFDNFPDRMIPDNSFGIFLFPSASPFGYNGRFLYARTEVQLTP